MLGLDMRIQTGFDANTALGDDIFRFQCYTCGQRPHRARVGPWRFTREAAGDDMAHHIRNEHREVLHA